MMRWLLVKFVRAYQLLFSAWIGPVCRYYPSCSNYALEALNKHGAAAGAYLAASRVLRCNPWSCGGCDFVPDNPPALFSRLGLTGAPCNTQNPKPSHD